VSICRSTDTSSFLTIKNSDSREEKFVLFTV
jgi:hypothetical protein